MKEKNKSQRKVEVIFIIMFVLLIGFIAPIFNYTIKVQPVLNDRGNVEVIYSRGNVSIWDEGERGFSSAGLEELCKFDFMPALQEHSEYSIEKVYRVPLYQYLSGTKFEESSEYLQRIRVNVPLEKIEFRTIEIT